MKKSIKSVCCVFQLFLLAVYIYVVLSKDSVFRGVDEGEKTMNASGSE